MPTKSKTTAIRLPKNLVSPVRRVGQKPIVLNTVECKDYVKSAVNEPFDANTLKRLGYNRAFHLAMALLSAKHAHAVTVAQATIQLLEHRKGHNLTANKQKSLNRRIRSLQASIEGTYVPASERKTDRSESKAKAQKARKTTSESLDLETRMTALESNMAAILELLKRNA